MSKDRRMDIMPWEFMESIERATKRGVSRHLEANDITPLRKFGYHIRSRMQDRGVTVQDLVDKTDFKREDLIDVRMGSLPSGEILSKLNKLEEALGFEKGELLDIFNYTVGQ